MTRTPITPGLLGRSLPIPPAADRAVWGQLDEPTLRSVADRAAADRASPWPVPLATGFARYFRDGDRDEHENVVWDRERRVSRAAVMAAATLDPVWLDEVADGVILLCEQSTWCWAAHEDAFERHGSVLPVPDDPTLDLGAGEVAGQLAWIDHLLGDQLDERMPGVRARLRHEVDRRVLTPFETRRDWRWLGRAGEVNNWNPWIHGNVLVAALSLVDDPARRAALVTLVLDGLDIYIGSLPADGAVDEGYSYWWNGAGRLLEALDILEYASGGALVPDPAALAPTVAFPHRVHLGGEWYLNHADGWARPPQDQPWHALHRAARRFGDRAAEAHAAAHRRPGEPLAGEENGLGRLLQVLTDPEWIAARPSGEAPPGDEPPPGDVWFPSTQVLIARSETITLAVKGGDNGENHNHNDVGSVVVALRGVPVLVDPGRPTYTRETFGPDRYRIWTMRSDWHNTPTIRGTTQRDGRSFAARDVRVDGAAMTLGLAGAYPIGGAWRRTARLDHDVVVMSDEWDLDPAGGDASTLIHLVLAGTVTTGDGWAEVVALDDAGTLRITWTPVVPAAVVVRELTDPMLADVWGERLTRLDIDVTGLGPVGRLDLVVKEQR